MPKYIQAVDAAEKISEKYDIPIYELVDVFQDIPSADVKEVVHAKWKRDYANYIRCSVCCRAFALFFEHKQICSKYRSCCGAKKG